MHITRAILTAFRCGWLYIEIPFKWENWPDADPEEAFRRFETLWLTVKRDNPTSWEPARPCIYRTRYYGRPRWVFAGFGFCFRIVRDATDTPL
jgi:hypothetical protein